MAEVPDYSSVIHGVILPLGELGRLNDAADATRAAHGEDAPETQAAEHAVNQVKGACTQTLVNALNEHEGAGEWGLLKKASGQHWTRSDGVNLSTDIAFNKRLLRLVDVMTDRAPSWDVHGPEDQQPVSSWVAPLGGVEPTPDPPPVPSGSQLDRIEAVLGRIAAKLGV